MNVYLRVISYFRKDAGLIGVLLSLIAISIGVGLLYAWPMPVLIDSILNTHPNHDFIHRMFLAPLPHSTLGRVIGITLIGMFLKIAQDGLTLIKAMVNRRVEYNGLIRVRSALFRKLQSLGPEYHTAQPQGDAIYRVTFDCSFFKDILNTIITTATSAVTLLAMIGIMLTRNIPLTIYALSIFPFLMLINRVCGPRIHRAAAISKQQETDYTTTLQRSMSVISIVQAFARETREFGYFKTANLRCARGWMRLQLDTETYWFLVRTVFSLGGAVIFGYGGYLVYRDQFILHKVDGMTCGDLLAFMSYLASLWGPLQDITSFSANVQTPLAAVERVFSVMNHQALVQDKSTALHLVPKPRELCLRDVSFAYQENIPVLDNISACVKPGQMVAFVGPSGAGKSTLLSLLNRFRDPVSGSVALDGHNLRDVRLADVRRHIALVQQDTLLLPATIAENISYGNSHASMSQIKNAAKLAGADDFISELPQGYSTVVTEGGQNLSGGQRQRLAIARAVLSKAPILVLDEPTSALDPQHTQQILRMLSRLRHRRTIVLVTHHLASVTNCDQIYVIDNGHLVEQGTHNQLAGAGGQYTRMLKREAEEEENLQAA